MRTIRIFQDHELSPGKSFLLDEKASHHLAQVLKISIDDEIILFNGNGNDYACQIVTVNKKKVTLQILKMYENHNESNLKIHLYQGLSKGDRMDTAIQKAVELGVTSITPLICERTVVRTSSERGDKKLQHWKNIIISACEQSGRAIMPKLNPLKTFEDCIHSVDLPRTILLHPGQSQTLSNAAIEGNEISLLVGPEGGFSDQEIKTANEKGVNLVTMGNRILRTETAPIAAVAVLQARFGDY